MNLARITSELKSRGIEYMVCGSVASILRGIPRTTQDIDIVVHINGFNARQLATSLVIEKFHVSEEADIEAVTTARTSGRRLGPTDGATALNDS